MRKVGYSLLMQLVKHQRQIVEAARRYQQRRKCYENKDA